MSSNIFNYVYRVTHLPSGKHYVGSRLSRGLPPQMDLGRRYFTSSASFRVVFRSAPLSEFRVKIVSQHGTYEDALRKEQRYLRRVGVPHNTKFYNKCLNGETFNFLRQSHSTRTKAKMSVAKRGNKLWLGRKHTSESRERQRESAKRRWERERASSA